MAAVRLFTEVDEWFADRGFVRHGSREPLWVKDLPYGLQLLFTTEPNKLSKDLYETRFGYFARFPALEGLEKQLYADSIFNGKPSRFLTALGLMAGGSHGLFSYGYDPIEASGSGPLWDEFLLVLDPALVKIEEVITRRRDFRPDVADSPLWESAGHRYSEILVDFRVGDFDRHAFQVWISKQYWPTRAKDFL